MYQEISPVDYEGNCALQPLSHALGDDTTQR